MSGVGAPIGNRNAAKGKEWASAIRRVLARVGDGDVSAGLEKIAMRLVKQASEGNVAAWKEIGDRVDGKVHQSVDLSNPDGSSIFSGIERAIIDSQK